MPVKFCLEFMPIIRSDRFNSEWEFFYNIINKIDSIGLIVSGRKPVFYSV